MLIAIGVLVVRVCLSGRSDVTNGIVIVVVFFVLMIVAAIARK